MLTLSTCCQTLKHFDNVFATGGNNMASNYDVHSPPVFFWKEKINSNI